MPTSLEELLPGLFALTAHGIKLDLNRMRSALDRFEHPERSFPSILIAGTNGKGSTAAFIESILRASGYKTGLYTSPHLVRFNERICVNGNEIEDKELVRLLSQIGDVICYDFISGKPTDADKHIPLTFFEVATMAAFLTFKEAGVDIAVLEIGLGGRLDATNTVEPIFTVITPIGYDHLSILGNTLTEIAGEKAGTMRKNTPVLLAISPEEARTKLLGEAKKISALPLELKNHLIKVDETANCFSIEYNGVSLNNVTVSLYGGYQLLNGALAVLSAMVLQTKNGFYKITEKSIRAGLNTTKWRGRFEWLDLKPPIIIDGSHNVDGMRVFIKEFAKIKVEKKPKKTGLIFASTREGFLDGFFDLLAPYFDVVALTQSSNPRTVPLPMLNETAKKYFKNIKQSAGIKGALDSLFKSEPDLDLIVITGSLYLVGDALAYLETATKQQNSC